MNHRRWVWGLLPLCVLWAAYAGFYIHRTSFVISGVRYFTLFDDAMVSMTYARNLAQGHGLVWAAGGERVEGYTNLLWTLYMAGLHLTRVPAERICLLVQLTALGLLALNLALVWRLTDSVPTALAAVVLVAFYQPLNTWSLQGMEVAALAPLVTGCLLLATRWLGSDPPARGPGLLYLLLGLGTLLRPDAAVLLLVFTAFLAAADPAHRRQHLLCGALSAVVFVGGQTLFRVLYYHELLPNTYYLKMTGFPPLFRVSRGLLALGWTIWNTNWLLCLLPGVLLLRGGSRPVGLLLTVVAAQALYSAYAGGDAWEWTGGANRYVAIVAPAFLVLLALALAQLGRRLELRWPQTSPVRGWLAAAALCLIVVDLGVPSVLRPNQEYFVFRPPLHWAENQGMVGLALLTREVTAPEACVGVVWAGIMTYFSSRPTVDLLGKCDRHLARMPALHPAGSHLWGFYPGHLKWDMNYTLTVQRPDFIPLLFTPMVEAAGPALPGTYDQADYRGTMIRWRRDDPKINVPRLRQLLQAQ